MSQIWVPLQKRSSLICLTPSHPSEQENNKLESIDSWSGWTSPSGLEGEDLCLETVTSEALQRPAVVNFINILQAAFEPIFL